MLPGPCEAMHGDIPGNAVWGVTVLGSAALQPPCVPGGLQHFSVPVPAAAGLCSESAGAAGLISCCHCVSNRKHTKN